jgi:hypothetical protein
MGRLNQDSSPGLIRFENTEGSAMAYAPATAEVVLMKFLLFMFINFGLIR